MIHSSETLLNSPLHCELCAALGFVLIEREEAPYYLDIRDSHLVLVLPAGELALDWQSECRILGRQKLGAKEDLFARALRPASGERIGRVLDLTCGSGRDSLHLLALGLEVVALERDPYLFLLQYFESRRLGNSKLQILFGEAQDYLQRAQDFDVIYFDPMYESSTDAKKRKAAPRKEMQLFYQYFSLIDFKHNDEREILKLARQQARRRVVVKRALKAAPIAGERAPYSYLGKSTRYDGYPPLSR